MILCISLTYLVVTHADVMNTINVMSQFMYELQRVHWEGALQILAYIKLASKSRLIYR